MRDLKQQPAVRLGPCGGIIPPHPRAIAGREQNVVVRDIRQQSAVRLAPHAVAGREGKAVVRDIKQQLAVRLA